MRYFTPPPEEAGAERSVLSVLGDADHVRFWLDSATPYGSVALQMARPCVYSARTGVRVRNVELVAATARMQGHLVFDPEHGPGEYEIYSDCSDHHLAPEPDWRAAIPADPQAVKITVGMAMHTESNASAAAVACSCGHVQLQRYTRKQSPSCSVGDT